MDGQKDILAYLSSFLTDRRNRTIERALDNRTRYLTVALEDIYQSQNASAVLRTCECFGIQDVHIIENRNEYKLNPDVVLGAAKWLSLHSYDSGEYNTRQCIETLKGMGYRIVATVIDEKAAPLEEFDVSRGRAALFFGTELTGLTPEMVEMADERLYIPIHGFTESFNISVSAAIILHWLTSRLRDSGVEWKLGETERDDLKLVWLKQDVKDADGLIRKYLSGRNGKTN